MLGRPSKVISSSMNAFLWIWDVGVCPKGSYSTGQTFWPVDGATVIAGGHQYCWLSCPSRTHRRQGFSPFVQSGRAMKLALNFVTSGPKHLKANMQIFHTPFPASEHPWSFMLTWGSWDQSSLEKWRATAPESHPDPQRTLYKQVKPLEFCLTTT